ncbi:MAG: acylphosphatase [Acetobacteraceae bacterium]|nr:acylphosphatase [Acetobacteraceae bacterium]
MIARRLIISGRVQGVGYRAWLRAEAEARGLRGWVRNRLDGTVEALLAGTDESVGAMIVACHSGPRMAVVLGVTESAAAVPDSAEFSRLPSI